MRLDIQEAFNTELRSGYQQLSDGNSSAAYHHFERAHILGQYFLFPHMRSHWAFLVWGFRNKDLKEIFGQVIRLFFGFFGSLLGWLPKGNTGGANVSSIKPMPVPEDLERLIRK